MKKLKSLLSIALIALTACDTPETLKEPESTPIFTMGEDGSKFYRIPALVKAADGALVAVADKRGNALGDLPNIISIVSKRSTDGGKTWSDMSIVAQGDTVAKCGYGDAVVIADEKRGNLVAVFSGNNGLWQSNEESLIRTYSSISTDNGKTWGAVTDITDQVYGNVYGEGTRYGLFTGSGSGIDLPYANTLFVIDSDKLGLSQLYQLRGRIGRSNIEAYAYFSFSRNKTLTEDSYKRLDAIMEFSDFGSGYKIAMRDLEIRGAGDVLGKMQHGHMEQVGYDMYIKLLNEAVSEIKGEKVEELKEIKIDIAINAYLPNTYISQNENRIDFYTKVSKLSSVEEFNLLVENTKNIYGSLPKPVEQLCMVGLIKNLAQQLKVKSIKIDEFNAKIVFYEDVTSSKIYDFLTKTTVDFVLTQEKLPIITLRKQPDALKYQQSLLNFLNNCLQIKNK